MLGLSLSGLFYIQHNQHLIAEYSVESKIYERGKDERERVEE